MASTEEEEETKLKTHQPTNITITRLAYNQPQLDDAYNRIPDPPKTPLQVFKSLLRKPKCSCTAKSVLGTIASAVPLIQTLRRYNVKKMLVGDLIAGLSVGVMHIPQGLGFAILAGVAPVYGLYSSFWPVLIYAFLGTGHHVAIGTMAVVSLMINSVVEREVEKFVPSNFSRGSLDMNLWNKSTGGSLDLNLWNNISESLFDLLNGTGVGVGYGTVTESVLGNVTESSIFDPVVTEEGRYRADIASSLTLLVAIFQLAMALFRLGIVSIFMPSPFVSGFTTGAACLVITSQLKFLTGIPLPKHDGIFRAPLTIYSICKYLPKVNPATIITGIICIIILLLIKTQINDRFRKKLPTPIPAELIVVILGCVVSYFTNLSGNYGVKIVKHVPSGMPTPSMPSLTHADTYIGEAFLIAVVSFTLTYSMGTLMGSRHDYTLAPNQEMSALGLAHIVTACFSGFAGTTAPPRCFVLESTGGKTQVSGIVAAVFLLIVLLVAGPLFAPLPNAVLAAVIIVAILPLLKQISTLPRLWRVNKYDFFTWVVTCAGVTILDIDIGLMMGIGFAIMTLVFGALLRKSELLGAVEGQGIYVPIREYEGVKEIQGVKVVQFQGDLNFLSKERFKNQITEILKEPQGYDRNGLLGDDENENDRGLQEKEDKINKRESARVPLRENENEDSDGGKLIVDMSRMGYVDSTGIATLKLVQANAAKKMNTDTVLCCVSIAVLRTLEKEGMTWTNGKPMEVYPTVTDALAILGAS